MSPDQTCRELVKRLLLALTKLVKHQPPCWIRECLEDQVLVHVHNIIRNLRVACQGAISAEPAPTSGAVIRSRYRVDDDRERAVRIRNKLVHQGRFLSKNNSDWYGEYAFMIWLDFAALCRLSGYTGKLPQSIGR